MSWKEVQRVDEIINYLTEHKDRMWIHESGTHAFVWDHASEGVLLVQGDFTGNDEECNQELKRIWDSINN